MAKKVQIREHVFEQTSDDFWFDVYRAFHRRRLRRHIRQSQGNLPLHALLESRYVLSINDYSNTPWKAQAQLAGRFRTHVDDIEAVWWASWGWEGRQ